MEHLRQLNERVEQNLRLTEFTQIAKFMMLGGSVAHAYKLAESDRASGRVVDTLKAAAPAGGLGSGSEWGSQLADFRLVVAGFAQSLASVGVFDALLAGGMKRVPISSTAGAVSVGITGFTVGEQSAKQVSRLSLTGAPLVPSKGHAIIAVTEELLRAVGSEGTQLLANELRTAAVRAVDAAFITSVLLDGVTATMSSGATPASVRSDIATLLNAVSFDQNSRLYLIVTPLIAAMWSAMGATSTNASPAFEQMTPRGGTVAGIPVIISDALASTANVVLVDATGIVGGTDGLELKTLTHASIILDTAPDSPSTASTLAHSLWQHNEIGLLVERFWAARKVRTGAVAAITAANSYVTGFSPP